MLMLVSSNAYFCYILSDVLLASLRCNLCDGENTAYQSWKHADRVKMRRNLQRSGTRCRAQMHKWFSYLEALRLLLLVRAELYPLFSIQGVVGLI